MFEELKKIVFEQNIELNRRGLVVYTWGNVSQIDRQAGVIAIKPSGVAYETMKWEDIVLTDLDGNPIEDGLRASSDLPTHVYLYKAFPEIGGVVHTHSRYATAWAQAGRDIPPLGTTHADYFHGAVPCTPSLTDEQINGKYEHETGVTIAKRFEGINPVHVPGVIVKNHGPFSWGSSPEKAAYHATVLEKLAELAFLTLQLSGNEPALPQHILDKHYLRKHGKNAYYGQNSNK